MRAEDILSDQASEAKFNGVTVRKGSVAAFLANAAAFRDEAVTGEARAAVLRDIEDGLPALRAVGLFDVMDIRDPDLRAFVEERVPASTVAAPDLDALYSPPSEMIRKGVMDHLVDFHKAYLKAATFFCLATGSSSGLDASPRGGPPGFVHVLDEHTVAFADWPGNNRIESLRNLERDDRLGMVFIFPGLEIFLRINGHGRISTDPDLLAQLGEGIRKPKTATVVLIDEVLLHCGKAVNRARLWAQDSRLDRNALPTVGEMMALLTSLDAAKSKRKNNDKGEAAPAPIGAEQIGQINAHYDQSVRNDLY